MTKWRIMRDGRVRQEKKAEEMRKAKAEKVKLEGIRKAKVEEEKEKQRKILDEKEEKARQKIAEEIERQRKETLNHKKNQDTVILGGNRRFNELNKLIERVVESTVIFIHALGDNNVIILFAILIVLFLSYFNL